MALIDKKLTWTVKSKAENDQGETTLNFVPTVPAGCRYASPSEGIFVVVPTTQCTLNAGDTVEGITVAQVEETVG